MTVAWRSLLCSLSEKSEKLLDGFCNFDLSVWVKTFSTSSHEPIDNEFSVLTCYPSSVKEKCYDLFKDICKGKSLIGLSFSISLTKTLVGICSVEKSFE